GVCSICGFIVGDLHVSTPKSVIQRRRGGAWAPPARPRTSESLVPSGPGGGLRIVWETTSDARMPVAVTRSGRSDSPNTKTGPFRLPSPGVKPRVVSQLQTPAWRDQPGAKVPVHFRVGHPGSGVRKLLLVWPEDREPRPEADDADGPDARQPDAAE